MSNNTLSSINFDRYFSALHELIPNACGFTICNYTGTILATSCSTCNCVGNGQIDLGSFIQKHNNDLVKEEHSYSVRTENTLFKVDIHDNNNRVVAYLLAVAKNEYLVKHHEEVSALTEKLRTVSSFINKEYTLTEELNAMATELAGRYEELNLVYATNDDGSMYANETDAINHILESCVEYMDASVSALIIPDKEVIYCATGGKDPVQPPSELMQQFSSELYSWILSNNQCVIINELSDPLRSELNLTVPYKIMACPVVNSQGNIGAMLVSLNQMHHTDYFNSDKNMLGVMSRKISKIMNVNYDPLTGLLNTHAFTPLLKESIETVKSKGISHSFLNIDIDQLRVINDSFGRVAGDTAINFIANIIKEKLRAADTISYLGEGRFGVLLEQCPIEQGIRIAESLREAVASRDFMWDSRIVDICVSIGMALIEPQTENTDAVLEAAEMALESAKENGVNQIQVFRHGSKDLGNRKDQMQWVSRIHDALRENRFMLYCQEIQPLANSNENYHFEILLRLSDEDGTVVSPSEFITPAERFNLMPIIDRWVIDKAFSVLRDNNFSQRPHEGVTSINLSGQSLTDIGLIDYIIEKLTEYQLRSSCICFEITETAAVGNIDSAKNIITTLRDKGFRFSLDDFGTGLSSFSYLKDLPVDYLKIDGSFVRMMTKDKISHAMVSSINQIGHIIGLKTIAEYVENDEIKEQLKLIGVDYAQGYSICEPIPLENYLASISANTSKKAG